jgi:hypothetical protein
VRYALAIDLLVGLGGERLVELRDGLPATGSGFGHVAGLQRPRDVRPAD